MFILEMMNFNWGHSRDRASYKQQMQSHTKTQSTLKAKNDIEERMLLLLMEISDVSDLKNIL